MAYIGNTVQNQGFTPAIDYFNGNGVTVTFTLSRPIASVAQLIVAIDNVIQNPSTAFSVSGNSITFTSAPLSGTNNIWVEYTSLITTYAAISQDPSVIGDISATGGYLAEGDFGNTFIDGTIVDYVTGTARITTGPSDGMTFYNGGTSGRTPLLELGVTGNINIPGTGKRITGDMSNATVANRVAFQSSTSNGNTDVNAIPNGTNTQSQFSVHNNSDLTNCARATLLINATETSIRSNILGGGTYLPITMYTNNAERLRIDTSGNVGIGTNSPVGRLNVVGSLVQSSSNASDWATIGSTNAGGTYPGVNLVSLQVAWNFTGGGREITLMNGDTGGGGVRFVQRTGTSTNNFIGGGGSTGVWTQGNNSSTWTTVSDSRIKQNIRPVNNALDKLVALNPCHFEYIDKVGKIKTGFIAQEFETVFPGHIVEESHVPEQYKDVMPEGESLKGIDADLIPYLVKAFQELKATVDAQAARIAALEAK